MVYIFSLLTVTFFVSCSDDDSSDDINDTSCDLLAEIASTEEFNNTSTTNYSITEVQLDGDCLEFTISSSGCDPDLWEMNLLSTNSFFTVFPLQRAVKLKLINDQACQAVFQKTLAFDLIPYQIDGQNSVPLNIEGWNEQVTYEY